MDRRIWFWASVGLSLAVTAILWSFGVPGFFAFLFLPFLFFPARRPKRGLTCASCAAALPPDALFCQRCGHRQ